MLTKTLQIAAICFSMANPSNFHIDNPKKANTQYDENIAAAAKAQNTRDGTITGFKQRTVKMGNTYSCDAFMLNYETISQTSYEENTNFATIHKQVSNDNTPSELEMIQFTPYKNLVNNQIRINLNLNIQAYSGTETVVLETNIYISQDNRWLSYIDQTSYASLNNNLNIIRDIENPINGFIYTKTTQSENYTFTQTQTETTILIQTDVPVNPNETNYIFIITYAKAPQNNEQNTGIFVKLINDQNLTVFDRVYANKLKITGEYINANINYEVIDVPAVMFEVLTMPFTFISIAFNLTLFPNTPYQINISNLFLSIIGVLVFMLIIKKVTGK